MTPLTNYEQCPSTSKFSCGKIMTEDIVIDWLNFRTNEFSEGFFIVVRSFPRHETELALLIF